MPSDAPGAPTPDIPSEPWKVAVVPAEPPDGDLTFPCPRCETEVTETSYGPCRSCRTELRAMGGERREVEVEYVPKMNVTPNAVALKE